MFVIPFDIPPPSNKVTAAFLVATVVLSAAGHGLSQKMQKVQTTCEGQYAEQLRRGMVSAGGEVKQQHFTTCGLSFKDNARPVKWSLNKMAEQLKRASTPTSSPSHAINS